VNCLWHGTLEDALLRWPAQGWGEGLVRESPPGDAMQWSVSLPLALDAIASHAAVPRDLQVALECRLPFNGQRVDLLLLGRCGTSLTAHVIELKHWSESTLFDDSDTLVEVHGEPTPHPSYQAATYVGKVRHLHSEGVAYEVAGTAVVTAGTRSSHTALLENRFGPVFAAAPLVLPDELSSLGRRIAGLVPEAPSPAQTEKFLSAEYTQSLQLLQAIDRHAKEIERGALASLAVAGWGLSAEQHRVLGEVLASVKAGAEGTFIISGGPGSGKTLLALHLLLLGAGLGKRVILGIRNNRMNEALREILNKQVPGAKGMLKYFSVRGGHGVEDPGGPEVDLLVCDEAQRLSLTSERVFTRAPVTVVIYDEGQILNADDRGTLDQLRRRATEVGKSPRCYSLPAPHRCRGGEAYVRWVNQFLADPAAIRDIPSAVQREYTIVLAPTITALRSRLRREVGEKRRVALLASFTRGSGKSARVDNRDLGKVRVPPAEANPPIEWLMDPRKEYVPFWVEKASDELSHCASIYGCQGFETDFAGLIWGTDFVVRDGSWKVGDPQDCYDTIGPGKGLRGMMESGDPRALELLRNRYRIFLTRGIFGTVVHCEDAETNAYLAAALDPVRPEEGPRS
jgi:DUF2075 family protein